MHNQAVNTWIILRTAGRSTLALADSLASDGYEVWAPARESRVRRARWNASRNVRLPLMASFVFAREKHLVDLLELAEMPVKPRRGPRLVQPSHPDFTVFHYLDRIPVIADAELDRLRAAETDAATEALKRGLDPGDRVLVPQGIFGGMSGIVERSNGEFTLVRFGSKLRVKISTFILKPIQVISRSDIAARKAA